MKRSLHFQRGDAPSRWRISRLEGAVKNRGIKKDLKAKKQSSSSSVTNKPQGFTESQRKQYQLPDRRH